MNRFRKELQTPPNEYRSAPFWAWNEWMEHSKIRQQIDEMKSQHMGGCFIHSREGLEIEYLSDKWMDCVKEAVSYGKNKNLDIWLYDEDKWPSGMAGGMVTKENPGYRAKALTLQLSPDGNHTYQVESSGDSEWYNGFAPGNNLDFDSVHRFLELTHEHYARELNGYGDVKGYFTDEPNVCDFFAHFTAGRPWLPWSDHFEDFFESKRGYRIGEDLDALFWDLPDSPKIRHDYCRTITELFGESYFGQISQWIHNHQMQFSGHLLFENDLGYNTRTSGAIMPHYRYFDIPGIDILGEQDEELLTVKQCTSVAHQFGKKHVMTETYGCTKWNLGLEGQKWLGDWQFIMGVNMRCEHLFMYSIKGLRKRDYPPVFSPQTTLWKQTHILEDYFARFAVCSTYGQVKRDILVIHPQSSVWIHSGSRIDEDLSNWDDNMGWLDGHFLNSNQLGYAFSLIIRSLLVSHRDCDLGDEMLLEQFGYVENGLLYVEQAAYKTVLIPPIENIFASTIKLLNEFIKHGGRVVTAGKPPCYVDGEISSEGEKFYRAKSVISFKEVEDAIHYLQKAPNEIEIINRNGVEDEEIWTMYREIPEGYMLICSNHDRSRAHEVRIGIEGKGNIEKINLLDGTSSFLPAHYDTHKNKMIFIESIGAVETEVYILHEGMEWEDKEPIFCNRHPHAAKQILAGLEPKTTFTRELPNVLPLDYCRFYYDNKKSDIMPVWEAQKKIREMLQMRPNWYNGAPQRYLWNNKEHKKDGTYIELEFEFDIADENIPNIKLAVEELDKYNVVCNGEEVFSAGQYLSEESYYLDSAIKTLVLPQNILKTGKNTINLQLHYKQNMELEDAYLLGDFAVNQDRELVREKKDLIIGDWCLQGYPFYGGGIVYHFEWDVLEKKEEQAYLYLQEWKAAAVEVYVNETLVGTIGWKGQDGINIAEYLKIGTNKVDINVIASPRNIFGPFHQKREACIRSSFKDYRTTGDDYTKEYIVEPQGLMKPVVIITEK